jgi:hypothetical protein
MIGVFRGFSVPPEAQDDAQRLVKRRHRIAGVRPVIDGHRHIPAVDDAPVTRLQSRMVYIGVAAALFHDIDRPVGETDRRIGQGQTENALLRT